MTDPIDSSPAERWWEGAALYQVYVRSFADSNGDGYGDLRGLIDKLDHLAWLGVDGVWLSPTMPSPDTDWGYDVSDYFGVHPELGTVADLEELVKEAGQRDMRVLLDLVPNHTSSAHPWFVEARSGREAPRRDYYLWADPAPSGGPPNNWLDSTGECAWTLDEASGQYYMHNFLDTQPDLNWWNPAVHEEFASVLRYWFDKGVAGFRIDVAHGLYKDAALRDNPPLHDPNDRHGSYGFERKYSMNRPETHGVFREWRALAEEYVPAKLLLGETWVLDLERLAAYFGDDDELHLSFNFPFALAPFDPEVLAGIVRDTLADFAGACPVWTASNHDIGRFASHWAENDERRTRLALMLLATLPGTVVLYYGDEVGMTDVAVPRELQRDPMTWGNRGNKANRDRGRTPLVWTEEPGAGFSAPGVRPWLPIGALGGGSVERQRRDPASVLHLTRALLALRRVRLGGGVRPYEQLAVGSDRWLYRVGDVTVALNFSAGALVLDRPRGELLLESAAGTTTQTGAGLVLPPYTGAIFG